MDRGKRSEGQRAIVKPSVSASEVLAKLAARHPEIRDIVETQNVLTVETPLTDEYLERGCISSPEGLARLSEGTSRVILNNLGLKLPHSDKGVNTSCPMPNIIVLRD